MSATRADLAPDFSVVLGGGGLAGIAWTIGALAAFDRSGLPLIAAASDVIGTSAGSAVATRVGQDGGDPLPAYRQMVYAEERNAEVAPTADLGATIAAVTEIFTTDSTRDTKLEQLFELAHAVDTVPADVRRSVVAGRLSGSDWPGAVRVVTLVRGAGRVPYDASSGTDLVDAVTASCAVGGLWPVVEIGGREHMDGGMFSATNADLARHPKKVVLAPSENPASAPTSEEHAALESAFILRPSETAIAAMGSDPFDPDIRGVSAMRGYEDGLRAADELRAYLAR